MLAMNDRHEPNELGAATTTPAEEQRILDSALREADELLARSLRDEQNREHKRRFLFIIFVLGAILMTTLIAVITAGWFSLGAVTTAERQQAESLTREGWQLWRQQQPADAEAKFAEAVKLDAKSADALNGLGWSRFNSGQRAKAIEAFKACVKLAPKHPAALNGLGQAYYLEGDFKQAERYLTSAAPQSSAAWYGLARLYLIQGQFKKALPYAQKIAKLDPNDDVAQQMLNAAKAEIISSELKQLIAPPGWEDKAAEQRENSRPANRTVKKSPVEAAIQEVGDEAARCLEDLRRSMVVYDLSMDQVLDEELKPRDDSRLELFPSKDAWPEALGDFPHDLADLSVADEKTEGKVSGQVVAYSWPLANAIQLNGNYTTLVFLEGVSKSGAVLMDTYGAIYCRGEMAGVLNSQSYSTNLIRGNVTGKIRNASYGHWIVDGDFAGTFLQESAGTLRVLGDFTGELKFRDEDARLSKAFLGGRTNRADLERISGRGVVYLEESDLADGVHEIGNLTVHVGMPSGESR